MIWQIILAGLLVLLPTQLGRHFWPKQAFLFGLKIDFLSPTLYLQDILAIFLILPWIWQNRREFFSPRTVFFTLGYLLLAFLNIFISPVPLVAFFTWLRATELILLGVLVSRQSGFVFSFLGRILPLTIIFEFFLGLAQVWQQSSLGGIFWFLGERSFNIFTPGIARASFLGKVILRPYGTFSHPNSLAGFILVCLILILGKGKLRVLDKAAVIAGSVLILLSFSRTVWLASFILALGWFLFQFKKNLGQKRVSLGFNYTLAAGFIPLVFFFFTKTIIDPSSFLVRRDLADYALALVKKAPLLGVGAGQFIIKLSQDRPVWQSLYWLQPVHNLFLLIASEIGLLGLALFLGLIFLAIRKLTRPFLLLALLAILFTGLFDHYWLTLIQNQLLLAIVLGLSLFG